jgi:hypothetical protein
MKIILAFWNLDHARRVVVLEGRHDMVSATWIIALVAALTVCGLAIAYGILSQRRFNSKMKPTRQDRIDEMSWRENLLDQ